MNRDLVSIIILNYNGKRYLKQCIDSCLHQSYKDFEIVVVDNNSSDNSLSDLPVSKKIRVLKNKTNTGYAQGNNTGVAAARGKFILIINNDTVLYKNMVNVLVKNHHKNQISIPAQIIMGDKDKNGVCGVGVDIFGYGFHEAEKNRTKLFYADGAAIFLERKMFSKLGGFDEKLFMFMEDIDLSWRAHLYGYSLQKVSESKLLHYSGGTAVGGAKKTGPYVTTSFRRYHNEKNVIRNIIKNYSLSMVIILLPLLFIIHFLEFLFLISTAKFGTAICYPKAYLWNLINISDTLRYRKIVQGKRLVNDIDIIKKCYLSYSKISSLIRYGIPKFL